MGEPSPAECRAAFPGLYCAIWPDLVARARSLGYALLIHGSLARDLDLVAVPWTEEAADADTLVNALVASCQGRLGMGTTVGGEPKAHGRVAWRIMLHGYAYIDLSVMPRLEENRG